MVGIAGRSRGCLVCRKRRIKCDEVRPTCGQCRKGRRDCPGSLTGAFFIVSTPDPQHVTPSAPASSTDSSTNSSTDSSTDSAESDRHSSQQRLPTLHQPSRAPIFDSLFIAHFTSSFSDPESLDVLCATTWIQALPSILSTTRLPPVQLSIRATVMALYGTLTGDVSIQSEAYRWYGDGLNSQRECLGGAAIPSADAICAPMMMSYFEIVTSTTPDGWMLHMEAAAAMLAMMGPEACRVGFAHQMLRTVYVAMTNNELPVFASERWKTVPFELDVKTPWDKLIDIFLSLPRCLALASESRFSEMRDGVLQIQAELLLWWDDWSSLSPALGGLNAAGHIAMFNTAQVVVSSLLLLEPGSRDGLAATIRSSSDVVLEVAVLVESLMGGEAAFWSRALLMVFPLKVIALWGPDIERRERAVKMLKRWGPREGLRGICRSSAPFVGEEEKGYHAARGRVSEFCRALAD